MFRPLARETIEPWPRTCASDSVSMILRRARDKALCCGRVAVGSASAAAAPSRNVVCSAKRRDTVRVLWPNPARQRSRGGNSLGTTRRTMLRVAGLMVMALAHATISQASVIQPTVVLPPLSGAYTLGGLCLSALGKVYAERHGVGLRAPVAYRGRRQRVSGGKC